MGDEVQGFFRELSVPDRPFLQGFVEAQTGDKRAVVPDLHDSFPHFMGDEELFENNLYFRFLREVEAVVLHRTAAGYGPGEGRDLPGRDIVPEPGVRGVE